MTTSHSGLVIAIVRGIASRDTIQQAYKADKVRSIAVVCEEIDLQPFDRFVQIDIPKAPPLGLVLQKVRCSFVSRENAWSHSIDISQLHYDRYDRKFGNDGHHEALTWEEEEVSSSSDDGDRRLDDVFLLFF